MWERAPHVCVFKRAARSRRMGVRAPRIWADEMARISNAAVCGPSRQEASGEQVTNTACVRRRELAIRNSRRLRLEHVAAFAFGAG
jgi:hypothetical protein